MTPRWSVVIPAFNEARRLPPFLDTVVGFFEGRDEPYEVIVVDDGSTDGTSRIVEARQFPAVRILKLGRNAGKGAAVRAGMLAARGAYRLFADADGATPIDELKRIEPLLVAGADVVVGSRVLVDPGVSVTARRHRVAVGRVFNWLVARVGLQGVAEALSTRGFGFDIELLMLAQAAGCRIVEVPVNWADQAESKVGFFRHGPGMLWQILKARSRVRGRS